MLLPLEKLFIEFVSEQNSQSLEKTKETYLNLKNRFDFSSKEYRKFCGDVHSVYEVLYSNPNERELLEIYKKLEYFHLFRHISYAFPPKKPQLRFKSLVKRILGYKTNIKPSNDLFNNLVRNEFQSPVLVDYGSGLGHVSFDIGKQNKNSKIYLVDIDTIILKFAEYYFRKNGIDVDLIKVNEREIYPALPNCNICICQEVLEHVLEPASVLKNIVTALQRGGLLYGNFNDHRCEFLHVSPKLVDIREILKQNFEEIGESIYRKK